MIAVLRFVSRPLLCSYKQNGKQSYDSQNNRNAQQDVVRHRCKNRAGTRAKGCNRRCSERIGIRAVCHPCASLNPVPFWNLLII